MIPLRITATTPAGFVASDPWSPSIDGILAWAQLRQSRGLEAMLLTPDADMAVVDDLPIETACCGDHVWYCCSSPSYATLGRHRTYLHRRFDRQAAEGRLDPAVRRLGLSAGVYKDRRIPRIVTIATSVSWHAIGEPAPIRLLLSCITHIGRDLARGRGEVSSWTVSEDGCEMMARRHRPLPEEAARRLSIEGPVIPWGLLPPARLSRTPCVMPDAYTA